MAMLHHRQLPPQIRRIESASWVNGNRVIHYQLAVNVGIIGANRKQSRHRYVIDREVREELSKISSKLAEGTYRLARSGSVATVDHQGGFGTKGSTRHVSAGIGKPDGNRDNRTQSTETILGSTTHRRGTSSSCVPIAQRTAWRTEDPYHSCTTRRQHISATGYEGKES